ncbi:MAG: hypothetical protein H7A27_07145 [Spirochaetaceae bacterium]|nr:hypothetical protein [Spirochaetaceae bacterium]
MSQWPRTPITLTQGFCRDPRGRPVRVRPFTGIIKRHADRMAAIVEDLLTLASPEGPSAAGSRRRRPRWGRSSPARYRVASAKVCRRAGLSRSTRLLACRCAPTRASSSASSTCFDNAVKYSPEGGEVRVEGGRRRRYRLYCKRLRPACPRRTRAACSSAYRVDWARSRELGGTGPGWP